MTYKDVLNKIVLEMAENGVTIHDLIEELNTFSLKSNQVDVGAKPHICVGMCVNREVTAESFTSLMMLYAHLNRNYRVSFTTSIATYLHEGRALVLQNAVSIHKQSPVDYLLWVDSDMVYSPNDFDRLLKMSQKKDLAFLSGLYFTKRSKACRPVFMVKSGKDLKLAENYPANTLLKVDGIGCGFFLCRFKELLGLYEKHGSKLFRIEADSSGRLIGEDIVLSKVIIEEGYSLWVWTDVVLGHEGGVVSRPHFHAVNSKEVLDKVQWELKNKDKVD